ncbi:MAG: thymidylate synthase, partial [Marinirhabdus sp.]
QFLIRENKLDLITTMRSNDMIWGLPNDIFLFTMIQEILASELKIESGNYYHQANSLHIYKRHFDLMNRILKNPHYIDFEMDKMAVIHEIPFFIQLEKSIRTNKNLLFDFEIDNYWKEIINVVKLRSKNYTKEDKERLVQNSKFRNLIKLCPIKYIDHSCKMA